MKKTNGKAETQMLEMMAEVLGIAKKDHSIQTETLHSKETQKIIIPEGMSKKQAAQDLMNQWENEEQTQDFQTVLEGWEWKDGLHAIRNVIEEKFGWLKGGDASLWEGSPTEITIITGYKKGVPQTSIAFAGPVKFPAWGNATGNVGVSRSGYAYIKLTAKRKYSAQVQTFFKELSVYLKNSSIYIGKPVVVSWDQNQERINLEIHEMKENNKIILNDDERLTVEKFILDELCEKGKRCFLFTGDYGNGKSETAMRIGIEANKKGVSFFYLKDSKLFDRVLGFAKNYEPCVVFVEDVDEIASGEERDAHMNAILNSLDGVQTKGRNITVLFTTNHEKRINKALRRPGRIDLIVNFANPEKQTIQRIMNVHFEELRGVEALDYDLILAKSPDAQAAVIAEIAKRAVKLAKDDGIITTDRVLASIASMKYQIEFMKDDVENADTVVKAFETVREYYHYNTNFNS